jgi:hypothetical protein
VVAGSPNPRRLFCGLLLTLPFASRVSFSAELRWPSEHQRGPFIFHSDFSLASHASLIAEVIALQADLRELLGVGPPQEPIHYFWFSRKSTYVDYLSLYFDDVPHRRALYIKRAGPGMVFAYEQASFAEDIRHESTHAILHSVLPMVPLWLDEGLAEYFEVPAEERATGHAHMASLRWSIRFRSPPPLGRLERIVEMQQLGAAEYRDAWSWVHFCMHGPPVAGEELNRFLRELQAGIVPEPMSARLKRALPDLDQLYVEHFRAWSRR